MAKRRGAGGDARMPCDRIVVNEQAFNYHRRRRLDVHLHASLYVCLTYIWRVTFCGQLGSFCFNRANAPVRRVVKFNLADVRSEYLCGVRCSRVNCSYFQWKVHEKFENNTTSLASGSKDHIFVWHAHWGTSLSSLRLRKPKAELVLPQVASNRGLPVAANSWLSEKFDETWVNCAFAQSTTCDKRGLPVADNPYLSDEPNWHDVSYVSHTSPKTLKISSMMKRQYIRLVDRFSRCKFNESPVWSHSTYLVYENHMDNKKDPVYYF